MKLAKAYSLSLPQPGTFITVHCAILVTGKHNQLVNFNKYLNILHNLELYIVLVKIEINK